MALKVVCGVYKLESPSGRIYIGQSKEHRRKISEGLNKHYGNSAST